MTEPKWLAVARSKLGTRELPGAANSPAIMQWARDARDWLGAAYTGDSVPWCGLFVARCVAAAGFKAPRAFVGLRARQWATWGEALPLDKPPPLGAIAVLSRDGGGHVFFVTGMTAAGNLVGIGGNQRDMVSEATFTRDRLIALRWPPGAPKWPPVRVGVRVVPVSTGEA